MLFLFFISINDFKLENFVGVGTGSNIGCNIGSDVGSDIGCNVGSNIKSNIAFSNISNSYNLIGLTKGSMDSMI